MKRLGLFICSSLFFTSCQKNPNLQVSSHNGELSINLTLDQQGALEYNVLFGTDTIIGNSRLGLMLDGDSLSSGFEITGSKHASVDKQWSMPWGQNKQILDKHNSLTLELLHSATGRKLGVEFRAFNDAAALRYTIEGAGDSTIVNDELTEIQIKGKPEVWWSYADFNTYEKTFMHTPLDSVSWMATPSIMRTDDSLHLAFGEAAVIDFPDMTLKNQGDGLFKVELTPLRNGNKAVIKTPFQSPWRTINIAKKAGDILMANTALNLSPESSIKDTKNFKPMTYIGVWWDFHLGTKEWKEGPRQGATTASAKRYIDFAAAHNIGGVVVEGWNTGWNTWGTRNDFDYVTPAQNYNLREVAAYAKEKGVRLIMHHETGADVTRYESMMDSAFKLCRELGITDIKTGHAGMVSIDQHHHSQPMVEHFERIAQKAGEYGIALNMHEPIKASGLERTYPNLMTREGVRGMEWEAWSDGNPPSHTVIIPFTRGLSGPTDYTPGVFDILYEGTKGQRKAWNSLTENLHKYRVHSTLAHQLSLMITIYSPWVMASDRIEAYENHPAFSFVESLNPDFDESQVVDAVVGEYLITARRTGDVWYVGASNNEKARTVKIPFSFLSKGKTAKATIYKDGDKSDWVTNPTDYAIETMEVNSDTVLEVKLASGGGAAIVIK